MKTITISSPREKLYALSLVEEQLVDGTMEVIVKKVGMSSTAKQRRLRFMWMDEVAASGLGRYDTKAGVDLEAKWTYGRPILLRDDEMFGIIYHHFMETIRERVDFAECRRQFARQYISIENMTKRQSWEYLTEFERVWVGRGVALTNPRDCGIDREKLAKMYA